MRSLEKYQKHLEKVKTCGLRYALFLCSDNLFLYSAAFPLRCHSDYCPICRRINLINLRIRLEHCLRYERWRFITLTFPQSEVCSDERFKHVNLIFDRFLKRLKRISPGIKFAKTLEVHHSGYPHIHLIVNHQIPFYELHKHWHAVGGGHVDVREGIRCHKHNVKGCKICMPNYTSIIRRAGAKYLTEELEKKSQDPHSLGYDFYKYGRRCFSTSRNLKLLDNKKSMLFLRSFPDKFTLEAYLTYTYFDLNIAVRKDKYFIGNEFKNNFVNLNERTPS